MEDEVPLNRVPIVGVTEVWVPIIGAKMVVSGAGIPTVWVSLVVVLIVDVSTLWSLIIEASLVGVPTVRDPIVGIPIVGIPIVGILMFGVKLARVTIGEVIVEGARITGVLISVFGFLIIFITGLLNTMDIPVE